MRNDVKHKRCDKFVDVDLGQPRMRHRHLPTAIQQALPARAKELFESVYYSAAQRYSEGTAYRIALLAVKARFVKKKKRK